ncbi:MAG: DUF6272 family protein [Byssovorax sp.]
MSTPLHLELEVSPEWSNIDTLRDVILRLVSISVGTDHSDALAMVSCELLENAVKYRSEGESAISFALRRHMDSVMVCVGNRVDPAHRSRLREQLAWLRTFSDPGGAYLAALKRVFEQQSAASTTSQLGLARIAFEGGCELTIDEDDGERVTVRAIRALPRPDLAVREVA